MKKIVLATLLSILATTSQANTFSGASLSGVEFNIDSGATTTTTTATTTTTSTTTTTLACTWTTAWSAEALKCIGGADNAVTCATNGDCTSPGTCLASGDITDLTSGVREYRTAFPANALKFNGVPTNFRVTLTSATSDSAEVDSASPVADPNYGMTFCPSTSGQICNVTPINITFDSGAKGAVFTGTKVSDSIAYTLDKTKRYLYHTEWADRTVKNFANGWSKWYISYPLQDLSGVIDTTALMAADSGVAGISKIEVCAQATSNWWNVNYGFRKPITSADTHSIYDGTADYVMATIDTVSANIQDDCDDLRIVWHDSTGSPDVMTEVNRFIIDCNSTTTKVYFKVPYYVNTNVNISTSPNNLYVYYGYASATCGDGVSCNNSYVNLNFPQAPYSAETNTIGLYHVETVDPTISFGNNACADTTSELCDASSIVKNFTVDTGTSTPTRVSAIGKEAINCDGTRYYKAVSGVTWDDDTTTGLTYDFWIATTEVTATGGYRRIFGSADSHEIKRIYNTNSTNTISRDGAISTDLFQATGPSWIEPNDYTRGINPGSCVNGGVLVDDGANDLCWYHMRVAGDWNATTDVFTYRVYWQGQDKTRVCTTAAMAAGSACDSDADCMECAGGTKVGLMCDNDADCPTSTCTDTADTCQTAANWVTASAYVAPNSFSICTRDVVTDQFTGGLDEFRVSKINRGAPEWISDAATLAIGTQEAKP